VDLNNSLIRGAASASAVFWYVSAIGVAASLAVSACAEAAPIDRDGAPQLQLRVVGHIAQSCSLGAIGAAQLQDLSHAAQTVSSAMPIHCNVPFQLNISSDNGGIVNASKGPGSIGGWSGRVGYKLTIGIPVLYPASGWVHGAYDASELAAGRALSSNGGVAFDKVHVELKTEAPTGAGLLAGDYSDVIRFSVSPQV